MFTGYKLSKVCTDCGEDKPREEYQKRTLKGREYLRTRCRKCANRRMHERQVRTGKAAENRARHYQRKKERRARGEDRERNLLHDSRKVDKRRGMSNDLTFDFILTALQKPCTYCGETDSRRLTLDRIDNTLGHTQANCLTACHCCNMIRRHMPYEAWKKLVPAVRDARESGAFGDWNGGGLMKYHTFDSTEAKR